MDVKTLTVGAAGMAACYYCSGAPACAPPACAGSAKTAPLAGPAADVRTYDSAVVDYVLDRIITTNDGGTATLDSQPCDGVRIITLDPSADGPFTPWERDGELSGDPGGAGPRGAAEWYVPWGPGPAPADAARGRLLFFHGGGYVWYAPQDDVYRSFGTRLAQQTGMAVLSIDYRLAPEHAFPAALEDADAALRWLAVNGFRLAVAGRTCWGEEETETRQGYAALFSKHGLPVDAGDPAVLALFPEMDAALDVPEITDQCWDTLGVPPETMMCATSRMVIKRKGAAAPVVVPCTLLPYDRRFELGGDLRGSAKAVSLNHPHCAKFCVLGGATCSSGG